MGTVSGGIDLVGQGRRRGADLSQGKCGLTFGEVACEVLVGYPRSTVSWQVDLV